MTPGVRRFPDKFGFLRLPEGGYGRDMTRRWWVRPPGANMRELRHHTVEEHSDGNITVMQRIDSGNGAGIFRLENGVWFQISVTSS